jgi:hypothetical protein
LFFSLQQIKQDEDSGHYSINIVFSSHAVHLFVFPIASTSVVELFVQKAAALAQ